MYKSPSRRQGFTLAELAIVLVIMTLLISGMLIPIGAQIQNRRISETQKTMEEIKDALIGYAITNKKLPLPAANITDGTPVVCSSPSANCVGYVPWLILGTNRFDAWGKAIKYSVDRKFTEAGDSTLTPPCNASYYDGSIELKTRDTTGTLVNYSTHIAALLFSFGAKNFGTSEAGISLPNNSSTPPTAPTLPIR